MTLNAPHEVKSHKDNRFHSKNIFMMILCIHDGIIRKRNGDRLPVKDGRELTNLKGS